MNRQDPEGDRSRDVPEVAAWVFPELPIITAPPPVASRTEVEKYGTLFYLGIAGLVIVLALVTWFSVSVYGLRDLWAEVYILNDRSRPLAERIGAAERLSRDPRLDDHQRFEMSLNRDLPDRARYVLAESVTADAVAPDPRTFALAVARSPNWPVWLRLLYTRLLAYAAAKQFQIPREALEELASVPDSMTRIWAACALLFLPNPPEGLDEQIEAASHLAGPDGELSRRLLEALRAAPEKRAAVLDSATLWLRDNHPDAARIWQDAEKTHSAANPSR